MSRSPVLRLLRSYVLLVGVIGLVTGLSMLAHADFVTVQLVGVRGTITLQGRVKTVGRTISYRHPTLDEELVFPLDSLVGKVIKHSTAQEEFGKLLGKAGKDPDQVFQAGVFALKRGRLPDYWQAMKKVLELDPKHEAANKVMELKKLMDVEIPETSEEEQTIKKLAKRQNMEIARSKHFILLHDTPDKVPAGFRKTRSKSRLDMLENVYQAFLLLFQSRGVELDVPKERLRVVLFNNYDDFVDLGATIDPSLRQTAGFYDPHKNFSVFYDHGSTEDFKALQSLAKDLDEQAAEAKRVKSAEKGDLTRRSKTIGLLVRALQEEQDITVVTHECTHQMAGNTGLLPRYVRIPRWAHEGLATYFETPKDAGWSGVGAVNEERLEWYRLLTEQRLLSDIEFIASDQIFDWGGGNHTRLVAAYGQAWALTHFLMENRPTDLITYYRLLGELPPDVRMSPELLRGMFRKVFGGDEQMEQLNLDWRGHMRKLKPDYERLKEEAEG